MTKIKLCGLTRPEDIEAANALRPDYIGFVFAPGSRRFVPATQAQSLKRLLAPAIRAVGVFVNEAPETVAKLLQDGVIDVAQLHGTESEDEIRWLQAQTGRPIWKAFRIRGAEDLAQAEASPADYVLLDAGEGSGKVFDWALLAGFTKPYFLAGGLGPENVGEAIRGLHPYAVDVSSGIETNGKKNAMKMAAFVAAVRKEELV